MLYNQRSNSVVAQFTLDCGSFSETKSTSDWPIALASGYAASLMHVGTRPVTVLIYHLSSPVLQCCSYLGLSQLNSTSLHDLLKVLQEGELDI